MVKTERRKPSYDDYDYNHDYNHDYDYEYECDYDCDNSSVRQSEESLLMMMPSMTMMIMMTMIMMMEMMTMIMKPPLGRVKKVFLLPKPPKDGRVSEEVEPG